MKIHTRLRLNTFISVGTVILILLALVWSWREISFTDRDMDLVDEMRKVSFERILLRDEYLLYQEERSEKQWRTKSKELQDLLTSANKRFDHEKYKALLQAAQKDFDASFSGFSLVMGRRAGQNSSNGVKSSFSDADLRQISQLFLKAYSLADNINRLHESVQAKAKNARDRGAFIVIFFFLGGIIAIAFNSISIKNTLAKRITVLGKGVEVLGTGNLEYLIPVEGDDELTALALASNEMADKLKRSYTSIEDLQKEVAERKRVEKLLQEQSFWLSETQRVGGIGSYALDFRSNAWTSSSVLDDIFGIDRDTEKTVASWNALVHPDEQEDMLKYFLQSVVAEKKPFNKEYKIIRKNDGEVRWLWGLGELTFDGDGSPLQMTGVIQDITERKRAEAALAHSEVRYRRLFETTKDGILILDAETGMVVEVNPFLIEMLGYSHQTFLGKAIWELGFFKDIVANQENFTELQQKEYLRYEDLPLETANGERIEVEFISNVYLVNQKKVIQCNIRNISERKRVDRALLESQRRLSEAQKMAQLGHWTWDMKTGSVEWSEEVYKIFHLEPNKFIPRIDSILSLSPWPEDHERDKELIRKAMESHAKGEYEQRFLRPNGTIGYYYSTFQGKYDAEDKLVSIVGTVQDITERKHLDIKLKESLDELQRSNKELEQFAYVASHDLQEPLRMVSSYTQLLAERYKDHLDDKANLFIHYAVDGAVRMQLLINDLLTFSRIGTKGKPLAPVDAHAVLGEAINNLRLNIEETKTIITNDKLPEVKADASQLVQLFQNLIGNAMKFRGAAYPHIHITVRDDGEEWLFSVKDNGIGIDPQFADKIFVIFQRLHTKEEYPGSGIGLAICKKIVERHGGRIWFESEPGKGATFYFTIHK